MTLEIRIFADRLWFFLSKRKNDFTSIGPHLATICNMSLTSPHLSGGDNVHRIVSDGAMTVID